jgi:hypothetical protein
MKTSDFIKENASVITSPQKKDHEIQMAREQCYRTASNAIKLHKLLESISEESGIDGWVSEKITLANDYMKTVCEYVEYELMSRGGVNEDASGGATGSASIGAAPATPLFKKKKVIKRNMQ